MLANWLRGGFEMDRKGEWRLKPQVADTLQRDLQAVMVQTGWTRSLTRVADKRNTIGTSWNASMGGGATSQDTAATPSTSEHASPSRGQRSSATGHAGVHIGIDSRESAGTGITASGTIDILNYDVRSAIAAAEKIASTAEDPANTFSAELSNSMLGNEGLRNRYLEQAASGRSVVDPSSLLGSLEQSKVLEKGRLSTDLNRGIGDDDPAYRRRKD